MGRKMGEVIRFVQDALGPEGLALNESINNANF